MIYLILRQLVALQRFILTDSLYFSSNSSLSCILRLGECACSAFQSTRANFGKVPCLLCTHHTALPDQPSWCLSKLKSVSARKLTQSFQRILFLDLFLTHLPPNSANFFSSLTLSCFCLSTTFHWSSSQGTPNLYPLAILICQKVNRVILGRAPKHTQFRRPKSRALYLQFQRRAITPPQSCSKVDWKQFDPHYPIFCDLYLMP